MKVLEQGKVKLYEEIADRIISLIDRGVLKNGDKVPSIRELSSQLGVSINTVKESYWHLESRNYIEAVPQSGYYVNNFNPHKKTTEQNKIDPHLLNPSGVSLCRIYGAFQKNGLCPPEAELGLASISNDLWPTERLNRCFHEAMRHEQNEAYNYCMPPGYEPLRKQLSLLAMKSGYTLGPDEFIITSGCTESIYLALSSICKPGDTVAIESPLYFNFLRLCEKLHLKLIEIPNSQSQGLHIETLKFAINNYDIKALLTIPNFNNPSGSCMSEERKEELVSLMEKHEIPLIEDDIYADLYYSGKRPRPCKAFDRTGNVILCSSFSKILAPGIRIGWIAPGRYYREIEDLKLLLNIGTAPLPQMAVAKYLQEGGLDRHLRKVRQVIKHNIERMRERVLSEFPEGTRITNPAGGYVLWVELPEQINSLKLYEQLLQKKIIIAPGAHFSMTDNYMNFIRLNAGVCNDAIHEAVKFIAKTVKSMM